MSTGEAEPPRIYNIEFKPSAAKALRDLDARNRRLVADRIDALSMDPRPPGSEKIKGEVSTYRIRSGDFRVIYDVNDEVVLVLVLRIGNRRDVYRKHRRG